MIKLIRYTILSFKMELNNIIHGGSMETIRILTDLYLVKDSVKVKQITVKQESSKVIIITEFMDDKQAKLVYDLINKYKDKIIL